MTLRKLIALILAFIMVLGLAACDTEPPSATNPTTAPATLPTTEPTTKPTTEPTTEPSTEPQISADELYANALSDLLSNSSYELYIQSLRTVTVAGSEYSEFSDQTVRFYNYGTDQFHATSEETVDSVNLRSAYTEQFQDGTLYVCVNEQNYYRGSMTAEEYTSRYMPLAMLDAALYEEITEQDNILTFASPTAGESWIVPEHAELTDATGTVQLDKFGSIMNFIYEVTYTVGGAEIYYKFAMIPTVIETAEPAPMDESITYVELEYIDAPRLMNQSLGYLYQANAVHSISASITESVLTQAGGALRNQSTVINSWRSSDDYMGKVDISISMMSSAGTNSYEQSEKFLNNQYSITQDGGDPTGDITVTAPVFMSYCYTSLVSAFPSSEYLAGCEATNLGSIYFLELTFNEDMAQALKGGVCSLFWNDTEFLDELAEEYHTTDMSGYLSIDRNTGLPLALGYYYEGSHTIQGTPCILSLQQDQSFDLVSTTAYETISEELPVPEEPEKKATPLFYHVTGSDGQEMWLLGTIHIGDARTSYLPQEIYDAFDSADALAVEFNTEAFNRQMEEDEEFAAQVSSNYIYSDGTLTKDHVEDEELFGYAEMYLKATGNHSMNTQYMKVSAWSNTIDNFFLKQSYDLCSTQGVDNQLIHRAEAQDKEILDVESGLFQVQMLMGFSDKLQEQLLLESVYSDPYEYVAESRDLFELWCAGNEAELIAYLNEEADYSEYTDEERLLLEEYNNALGTDRNDDMHDVAVGYLESGDVVFYAVGLAHLLAEDGLVNTLRDAGYTVELVTYEP